MKILVTGAKGFVGRNLIAELKNRGYSDIGEYDVDTPPALLDEYTRRCEFVFHLAGVNRPLDEKEFMAGNYGFTSRLLARLKEHGNQPPVLITSSVQASLDNPYGRSKKAGEDLLFAYGRETASKVLVYRLPNLFGKWCRPNYNSVVATFCHNIANGLPIKVNDPTVLLRLCYIDDVVAEFIAALDAGENRAEDGFCAVGKVHEIRLGDLADRLYALAANRQNLVMPPLDNELDKALYATLLSYLPQDKFSYPLALKQDNRGWLAEFIKSTGFGQIFISKTKPGITRGNHWHHTKVEKFLVVQGEATIRFRKIDSDEVLVYTVSGDKPEVVDIPVGYTHAITNTGAGELITLFWADEIFRPERPDTYYLEI
jgi:Nucleoside-diphosphate-sugar epimerases